MGFELISIIAPTRIHVSLLSLHENAERKYGGFGFAINKAIKVSAQRHSSVEIVDRSGKLKDDDVQKIKDSLILAVAGKGVRVWVDSMPGPHLGFGTGTSLSLSVIESALLALGENYDEKRLIALSGRGRTSGVGIETYFRGGAVFDIGVKSGPGFFPSSSNLNAGDVAKNIFRCNFPDWRIEILLMRGVTGLSGGKERLFFEKVLPLSPLYSYKALYKAVMGLIPSCIDGDLGLFQTSIADFQEMEWKRAEIQSLGRGFEDVFSSLKGDVPCIGMSSMGPLLYCVNSWEKPTIKINAEKYGFCYELVEPNNHGRVISHA